MSRQRRASVRPLQTTSARLRPGWAAAGAAFVALGLLVAVFVPGLSAPNGDDGPSQALPEFERAVDQSDDEDEADDEGGLTGDLADGIPVAEDVFLSRDPFDPVVPEEEPADGDSDDGDGATDGDGDGATDGDGERVVTDGDGDGVDTDGDGGDGCQGDEELVCDGQVVTLDQVQYTNGDPVAVFQVNTTTYEVEPGDAFADGIVFDRIDAAGCAVILFDGKEHQVCPGEARLK